MHCSIVSSVLSVVDYSSVPLHLQPSRLVALLACLLAAIEDVLKFCHHLVQVKFDIGQFGPLIAIGRS